MSAFAAVIPPTGAPAPESDVRRMLDAMRGRGSECSTVWCGERGAPFDAARAAALGASRDGWQAATGLAGRTLVAERDGVVVAADAALYYRSELQHALGRSAVPAGTDDPAELIAAAYLAFGDGFVSRLEGDFAFVLWDGPRERLVAACDHGGRRPLHYAELDGTLVVASTVGGVLSHPRCPTALDVASLAETAAGFLGATDATCYDAIRRVPAGHVLTRTGGGAARVARHWEPPTFEQGGTLSFDDAAVALRETLEHAVAERLVPGGTTAVFMSGGWDSPPVFAAGRSAMAAGANPGGALIPVSMSYPVGDAGREDETIERIAARWDERPRWCPVSDVALFDGPAERAARRDEPLAHVYELWNRALMRRAREAGARVALDGIGGDALFQISPVYLADLFAGGRWTALRREWREGPVRDGGAPAFARWAVRPAIPAALRPLVARLRGSRSSADYLWRKPPPWLRDSFVREHGIAGRGGIALRRRLGESRAALESRWHFSTPWAPSLLGALAGIGLEHGLESRSPFYDLRVIRLAATRPREERRTGRETKRLIRAAMRGLLPDDVLATRTARTGVTSDYFARAVRIELPELIRTELQTLALADLGIVDADAVRAAAAQLLRNPGAAIGPALWFTLQTEWWVRARLGASGVAPTVSHRAPRSGPPPASDSSDGQRRAVVAGAG